jgi:hypothetical protein
VNRDGRCVRCGESLPERSRADRLTCSTRCRVALWRALRARGGRLPAAVASEVVSRTTTRPAGAIRGVATVTSPVPRTRPSRAMAVAATAQTSVPHDVGAPPATVDPAVDPVAEARRVFGDMLADASDEALERPGWRDDAEGRAPDEDDDALPSGCYVDLRSGHRRAVRPDGTVYCATCHPRSTSEPAGQKPQDDDGVVGKVQRFLDIEEDFPRSAWDVEPPAEWSMRPASRATSRRIRRATGRLPRRGQPLRAAGRRPPRDGPERCP